MHLSGVMLTSPEAFKALSLSCSNPDIHYRAINTQTENIYIFLPLHRWFHLNKTVRLLLLRTDPAYIVSWKTFLFFSVCQLISVSEEVMWFMCLGTFSTTYSPSLSHFSNSTAAEQLNVSVRGAEKVQSFPILKNGYCNFNNSLQAIVSDHCTRFWICSSRTQCIHLGCCLYCCEEAPAPSLTILLINVDIYSH